MTSSLSFDPMAQHYDETRVVDAASLAAALEYLVERFPPGEFQRVLEPGVGTGRIAIPLARLGYQVEGVDISDRMLAILRSRLKQAEPPLRVSFRRADVLHLPFPSNHFDMVIVVHLFYFTQQWQKAADELWRVLREDGPMILMHTGMGKEIPFLNERYKVYCRKHGFPIETLGVSTTQEVADYFAQLGCSVESVRDRWQWTSRVRLDEAISYVDSRAYSFTTMVPHTSHSEAVRAVESEARKRFGGLTTEVAVHNQVYFVIARRPPDRSGSAELKASADADKPFR